jgi:hypothetical protein
VTIYSEPVKLETKVLNGQIYSSYSKEFIFISEESFSIPERIFSMFDPKVGEEKVLKTESFDIEIGQDKPKTMLTKTLTPTSLQSTEGKALTKEIRLEEVLKNLIPKLWIGILSFILGVVFFYLLHYIPTRKRRKEQELEALKILYGHISNDPEVEQMVSKLYARKNGDISVKIDRKRLKELVKHFS